MDIILFHPAPRSGWDAYHRCVVPLSLLYPATPLDRDGYRVTIVDQFADPSWKKKLLVALAKKPVCFGVTSMTGPQILQALCVCKFVKDRYPDVPIVWGGIHASLLPEQTLGNPYVDIVVVGEGEAALLELVKALENGTPLDQVAGIAYRQNGQYRFTGSRPFVNLDEQPSLAYHLIDINRYRERLLGIDHIHLLFSRGCTFDCAFCWDPVMHMRRHRAMQPERVLGNMQRVIQDFGIRGFIFSDDNFFVDRRWAYNVLEGVVRADLDICIGKLFIRPDTLCKLNGDFLEIMVRAGVKRLVMGAESGSERIQHLIKKRIMPEQILEANRMLIPYPIKPAYLFMMGLPTETPDEFAQSIRLAAQLIDENPKATRAFNVYTPFPGTELFNLAVQYGLRPPERLEDWAQFSYRNTHSDSPWILPETKKFISVLDFALMCSSHDNSLGSLRKADPIAVWLARAYSPLARYRVKHLDTRFPLETKLIKGLRFLMGRDPSRIHGLGRQRISGSREAVLH